MPQLELEQGTQESQASRTGRSSGVYSSLNFRWLLFDFGSTRATLAAEKFQSAALGFDLAVQEREVIREIVSAYYKVVVQSSLLDISREASNYANQSRDFAQARFDSQIGSKSDLLNAIVASRRAAIHFTQVKGELMIAQAELAAAMGLTPSASKELMVVKLTDSSDLEADMLSLKSILEHYANLHPAYLSAEAKYQADVSRIDSIKYDRRPKLFLNGGGRYDYNAFSKRSAQWGFAISFPLFDGYGSAYNEVLATQLAKASGLEAVKIRNSIELRLYNLYALLDSSFETIQSARGAASAAQEAIEVVQGMYKAGVGSMTDVLATQASWLDSEQSKIRALADWLSYRMQLAAEIGEIKGMDGG